MVSKMTMPPGFCCVRIQWPGRSYNFKGRIRWTLMSQAMAGKQEMSRGHHPTHKIASMVPRYKQRTKYPLVSGQWHWMNNLLVIIILYSFIISPQAFLVMRKAKELDFCSFEAIHCFQPSVRKATSQGKEEGFFLHMWQCLWLWQVPWLLLPQFCRSSNYSWLSCFHNDAKLVKSIRFLQGTHTPWYSG